MAVLYRGVLSRCQSGLETEVISEEGHQVGQAWLRVSDWKHDEHHGNVYVQSMHGFHDMKRIRRYRRLMMHTIHFLRQS